METRAATGSHSRASKKAAAHATNIQCCVRGPPGSTLDPGKHPERYATLPVSVLSALSVLLRAR